MNKVGHTKITPRDGHVLRMLVNGYTNKEIAAYLRIRPRAVKQYLHKLYLDLWVRLPY
jgi:DNA-binding NarL/FixJ family response regulator